MEKTTTDLFLELLRAGLWGRPADLGGACPNEVQWTEILRTAREQTVTGTLFDGISTLPAEQMPPRDLKFKMAAEVSIIEHRHAQMRGALRAASEIFDANHLSYMLLKGIAVGAVYPVPEHRISGDIDFWLPASDCARVPGLLFANSKVKTDSRHSSGLFHGIYIENHFELSHHKMERYKAFCHELFADDIRLPLTQITIDGYAVVCPSPTFHALFMTEHLAFHLLTGLGMRQICDWAIFLSRHTSEINGETTAHIIRKYGFERIANIFGILCADYLGMSEACAPLPLVRSKRAMRDVDFVMQQVMEGGNFGRHYSPKHSRSAHLALPTLLRKPTTLYVHFRSYPKYKLISRKLFWISLLFLIRNQFKRNFTESTETIQK